MDAPQCYCIVAGRRLPLADSCSFRLLLSWRTAIGTSPIVCPVCHSSSSRRSKRRTVLDYLFSLASTLPWRCESCGARFLARAVPLRNLFYAHCRICGNLELQRISAEYVPGVTSILGRILGGKKSVRSRRRRASRSSVPNPHSSSPSHTNIRS